MKECLHCGHECEDNVTLCPRCGRRFTNKTNKEKRDHNFNIDFNADNQKQSSDDYVTTVESEINPHTQEATFSNQIPQKNEGSNAFLPQHPKMGCSPAQGI